MTDSDLSNIDSIDSAEFARIVKSTPDAKLAEAMAGEQRTTVLEAIFSGFPKRFRPDRAGSTSAVIHWVVGGRADGGTDTYQMVIENGTCTTSANADRDPRLTLTVGAVDFLKVVSGTGNPMTMFMTGKLKAKGDLGLASSFGKFFETPKG